MGKAVCASKFSININNALYIAPPPTPAAVETVDNKHIKIISII